MVSGIDLNFYDMDSIKYSLQELDDGSTDGTISTQQKDDLSTDVNYFLDNLGDKTNVELTIEEVDKLLEAQASKEVSPNMDLSLDMPDISDIPDAETL